MDLVPQRREAQGRPQRPAPVPAERERSDGRARVAALVERFDIEPFSDFTTK